MESGELMCEGLGSLGFKSLAVVFFLLDGGMAGCAGCVDSSI